MEFNTKWIYAVSASDLFVSSITIPLMMANLRMLGASYFMLGLVSSICTGAQLIGGFVVGHWSVKDGRRHVFLIGLIVCTSCYILMGTYQSLLIFFLLRIILGVFNHVQILTHTIVADRVPSEYQNLVSSRLNALAVGFTIGPLIAGHLAELRNGLTCVYYFTAILFALNTGIAFYLLENAPREKLSKDGKPVTRRKDQRLSGKMIEAAKNLINIDWPAYWDILLLKFSLSASLAMFGTNFAPRIRDKYNLSPRWIGYTLFLHSIIGTIAGILAGQLSAKFYKDEISFKRRNLHGFVTLTMFYLGVIAAPNLSTFMLFDVPLKTSISLLSITYMEIISKRCTPSQRESLTGGEISISNVTCVVAPLLVGIMQHFYGADAGILLAAAAAAIGISLSLIMKQLDYGDLKKD